LGLNYDLSPDERNNVARGAETSLSPNGTKGCSQWRKPLVKIRWNYQSPKGATPCRQQDFIRHNPRSVNTQIIMLTPTRYHFRAAALPLALALFLALGSLYSCSENPPTQGKDSCDTCHVPCDTCDTTKPNLDSLSHAFIWTEYSIPSESNVTGVWVFDDTNIFIMGDYLYRFNGTTFFNLDPRVPPSRPISGSLADKYLFAFTPADYWIGGRGIVYHIIGDIVTEYRNTTSDFDGVTSFWGTSSNDIFFVCVQGNISHFDGTTFTKMTSPTTKNLKDVWGTSHNDVWATGYNSSTDESVLLRYDGVSWTEDEFSTSNQTRQFGIGSVWACDSAGHKVRTISGTRVFRKTDNSTWRKDSAEIGNSLGGGTFIGLGIRGNSANDLMTVGGWGFVSHWNGKTWHKYDELYNYGDATFGPRGFSMNGNTACVVGGKSTGSWIAIGRRKPF
jgi:hypothetical protein